MGWEILFIINLVTASLREFLYKKLADKVDPFVCLFYIVVFSAIWLNIGFIISYQNLPELNFLIISSGIIFIFAFISYFKALKISLSQSVLFSSYSILITLILSAIYLGEAKYFDVTTVLGIKTFSGVILAFVALWFLLHTGKRREEKLEKKWFYLIAVTILFLGIGSFLSLLFLEKYTPFEVVVNQIYGEIPILVFLMILLKKKISVPAKQMKLLMVNSFIASIAVIAFYSTLLYIPAAVLFPIQQVSLVMVTMVMGVVFYHETNILTGKRLTGIILGLLGMVMLITG